MSLKIKFCHFNIKQYEFDSKYYASFKHSGMINSWLQILQSQQLSQAELFAPAHNLPFF
jgi:hypothetical protein